MIEDFKIVCYWLYYHLTTIIVQSIKFYLIFELSDPSTCELMKLSQNTCAIQITFPICRHITTG